mgnify:FL=1
MIDAFKNIFKDKGVEIKKTDEEFQIACVAILCEAASMDGTFDEKEKLLILNLIQKQFSLDKDSTLSLYEEARTLAEDSSELYGFTKVLKNSWNLDKKIRMLEMLWEVAYVDGELDPAEDMLIRRIAGLIHVEDRDRVLAKQRVLNK